MKDLIGFELEVGKEVRLIDNDYDTVGRVVLVHEGNQQVVVDFGKQGLRVAPPAALVSIQPPLPVGTRVRIKRPVKVYNAKSDKWRMRENVTGIIVENPHVLRSWPNLVQMAAPPWASFDLATDELEVLTPGVPEVLE